MARQAKNSSGPVASAQLMDKRRELLEVESQLAMLSDQSAAMSVEIKVRSREISELHDQIAKIEDNRSRLLERLKSAEEDEKSALSYELSSLDTLLSREQKEIKELSEIHTITIDKSENIKKQLNDLTNIKRSLSGKFIQDLNNIFDSSGLSVSDHHKAGLDLLGHIRLDCQKCGQSFTTILERFLDSPDCPVCQKTSTPHGQRVQMNIRLLPEYSEMLSELVEHWKAQGGFEYHGLKAKEEDIKSPITFSRFLLQSSIRSLHANLLNHRRILELSQALRSFSFPDLPDDDDSDLDELKIQCRSWAIESWGIFEVQTMFESFWPHALQDARLQIKGPNTAEEEELLFRKMQLDLNSHSN